MVPPSLERVRRRVFIAALLFTLLIQPWLTRAEPIDVRYNEGVSHGFVRLRTEAGTVLADGEMTQGRHGSRVTSRLLFRFRDGSVYSETTVFEQRRQFRLISDHVVQRGPAFPYPMDMFIDATSGNVTVRYAEDGKPKTATEHLDLPADVANGIVQTLLKNAQPGAPPKSFAYVAATPKPRLVKLEIRVAGADRFSLGRLTRTATHYLLKVDLGGITGAVATVLGKQPPDSHVWIMGGDAPTFVRAEQPFFSDGPLWRIELAAPEVATGSK